MDGDFNNNEEEEYIDQQTYIMESEKKKSYKNKKLNKLTIDIRSQKNSHNHIEHIYRERKSEQFEP